MNKKIFLIGLLIFSMFLFFGCTENEPITPIENQTENNTTTLYFFYDPSWDVTEYNMFFDDLKEQLPGLKIEEKCIDIQKFSQGTASTSENLCVDKIGYLKYNENMKMAEEIPIQQSGMVLKTNGVLFEIPFSPISTAFANKICLEDEDLEGCSTLQEIPKIKTTIIKDTSIQEDIASLFLGFEATGLPILTDNIIDYKSEEAKKIITENEITTIPILIITPEAKNELLVEQQTILNQYVLMGYFEEKNGNIILQIPGNEIYVGQKFDSANLELFIMTHCPYGTQAQKAVIPVKQAFGDELNLTMKFVNYVMREETEIEENNIQYCLQEEHEDKFYEYLECFLYSGNNTECLTKIEMSIEDLSGCISNLDKTYKITELFEDKSTWSNGRYPQYNVHAEECQKYGVRGSPTFVLNGKTMTFPRSPEGIKQGICNMLEDPPEICNEELDATVASPGFGGGVGTSSSGTC